MTDLAAVVVALVEQLGADPLVGVQSAEDLHLLLVTSEAEWYAGKLIPAACVCVEEIERTAIELGVGRERATAMIEIHLSLDGRQGQGNHAQVWALAEAVRRSLITNRLLATGNPPAALLERSEPKGETYEVLDFGERGKLQTATVRWQATWLEPRTFDDAPLVSAKYLRTISIVPGVGATEEQPPIP